MCGFAGFLTNADPRQPRTPPERAAILRAMSRQVARRGPDDETFFDDGTLALAFRRLSIVDVAGGRQPFRGEDGLVVAVNGEIYDHAAARGRLRREHRFTSRSDGEVLVHLFEEAGADAFRYVRGMFAAVVWDPGNCRLLLARDRLGIQPLYVAPVPGGLLFASEVKALLVHPDAPAELAWEDVDV